MRETLRAEKVAKSYPHGIQALHGVDLSVQAGEVFGLLGPNGAGKTTLLNIFSTLLLPDSGRVWVLGRSVDTDASWIRQRVNLCSGNANFPWSLTVEVNLHFYAMLYGLRGAAGRAKVRSLLDIFGLGPFSRRRFDEVSTGVKQRLALAKSLVNDPEVLFLDEPTIGLDPDIAHRVRDYIRDYHRRTGATLILTTHYMPEAEQLCDRIAFIREGRILALDSAASLKHQVRAADLEGVFLELYR